MSFIIRHTQFGLAPPIITQSAQADFVCLAAISIALAGGLENSESGIQQAQRFIVENLLRIRFGELDAQLTALVTPLLGLPPQDLSQLLSQLSQLSREQLLARFPQTSS